MGPQHLLSTTSPTPSATLLAALHLRRKSLPANRWLLDDVSLQLARGDRLALVGPSGAGKSLLLRSLVLLDPLDGGEIHWQGARVRRDTVPRFRSQALYLHQKPAMGVDTVEAALRQPYRLKTYAGRIYDGDRARQLLARLGRDGALLNARIRDLSGGEAQIVALVRALQCNPLVLLLDEPTASLDGRTAEIVERLVTEWADQSPDRAYVWVSHDLAQARRMSRRELRMAAGRLSEG